jgi:hypothetical protein
VRHRPGLIVMVSNGRLVRIEVYDRSPVATRSGIHIGSTERDVADVYPGRITVEPHPYAPNGHYLVFTPQDQPDRLLIFETGDDKRVSSFRAGEAEAVRLIEGCL